MDTKKIKSILKKHAPEIIDPHSVLMNMNKVINASRAYLSNTAEENERRLYEKLKEKYDKKD